VETSGKVRESIKRKFRLAGYYLFHSTPFVQRSCTLTLSVLFLFFVSYKIISKIYLKIIQNFDYILIPEKYFFVFLCIAMLPLFGFLFFKLNIFTNFWKKLKKPHLVDCLFFGVIILFLYFSFNHGDIKNTSVMGKVLLDMVWRGINIREFYDYYHQEAAVYLLPCYILFGIWSIPVKIIYFFAGIDPIGINQASRISGFTLWWYKLLPTLFYIGSAFMVYKIGLLLKMDKNKAKWMTFIFFTFPMAVFSQFIFGQNDSIGVFFELLMLYFFLQRRLLIASLVCMLAVTFKVFPIFIFLPLMLLYEKRVLKIIGYTIIAFSGYLFFNLLFSSSEMFKYSKQFNEGMFLRLFKVGIDTSWGFLSFFILALLSACVLAYFINVKDKDELTIKKYTMYIPLFVYTAFFSFVFFHPQYILILVPYFVINIFLNKNTKGMMFIAMGANIGFLSATMSTPLWYNNVDANMINLGFLPKIFGFFNQGHGFKSLSTIVNYYGKIPYSLYISLFVGMLMLNLIIAFPNRENILKSKDVILSQFSVERDVVWINGLIVLIFVIPSILLFFGSNLIKYDDSYKTGTIIGIIGEISENVVVKQTFLSNYNDLCEIKINFATFARINSCQINLRLYDENDVLINEKIIQSARILDNSYLSYKFPQIKDSLGKKYTLLISSKDAVSGNAVTVYLTNDGSFEGDLYINDQYQTNDLCIIPGYYGN